MLIKSCEINNKLCNNLFKSNLTSLGEKSDAKYSDSSFYDDNSSINEMISGLRDHTGIIKRRKEALDKLLRYHFKSVKSLILTVIVSEADLMAEDVMDLLIAHQDDMTVRKSLWGIVDNKNNSQKIRLLASKVLVLREPDKVIETLLGLENW